MADRDRDNEPKARVSRSPRQRRDEIEALRRDLGEELPPELVEHLEDLQRVADAGIDFDDPSSVEAALRRLEYERIKREFKPRVPLYGMPVGETQDVAKKEEPRKTPPPKDSTAREQRRRSYQDDPRYRMFYDRLRSRQQKETSKYDEPPEFASLEELEQTGWDGTPRPWDQQRKPAQPAPVPPPVAGPKAPTPAAPPAKARTAEDGLVPGTILRFDDGSIAIYKDAVSGKDYALFYFLEPNGVLVPEGIFLDKYEHRRLGQLPPDLFEAMVRMRRWDRDAVIYHLDRFEFAGYIRAIAQAQPMAVEGGESAPPVGRERPSTTRTPTGRVRFVEPPPADDERQREEESPLADTESDALAPSPLAQPVEPPPQRRRNELERGRIIRISVAPGKEWEAVYWTSDELGPIVAHNTNREWSLMHLDLSRFKDAIEYGEILSDEELEEIEKSLARLGA